MFASPLKDGDALTVNVMVAEKKNLVAANNAGIGAAGGAAAGAAVGAVSAGVCTGGLGAPAGAIIGGIIGAVTGAGAAQAIPVTGARQVVSFTAKFKHAHSDEWCMVSEDCKSSVNFKIRQLKNEVKDRDIRPNEKYLVCLNSVLLDKGNKDVKNDKPYYMELWFPNEENPMLISLGNLKDDRENLFEEYFVIENKNEWIALDIKREISRWKDPCVFWATRGGDSPCRLFSGTVLDKNDTKTKVEFSTYKMED